MSSSAMIDIRTTDTTHDVLGYSLVLSLALHIGAALVFIVVGSFMTGVGKAPNFIIQDVMLVPSINASNHSMAPPPFVSSFENTPSRPTAERESVVPAQEPPRGQLSATSADSSEGGPMSAPLGLGMTHGYFSDFAGGRSLRDDIRGYYFEMVAQINREWWNQAALLKEPIRQDGIFDVLLQRDGTIVSIQIKQGTGLPEADKLLIEIIRKASPLPSLPSTYDQEMFRAPLRIKAPSFLFRLGK